MTSIAHQETQELKQRLAQLVQARAQTRRRPAWIRDLVRRDLEELQATLMDLERGYGPSIGRLPALLHRERFHYLREFDARNEHAGTRLRAMAPAEEHLSQAA